MTDLAMMELIFVSPTFRGFVLDRAQLAAEGELELASLRRSVFETSLGETDVELVCRNPGGRRVALLIENKVRAPLMERQFERYAARGRLGIETGNWDAFRVVLAAPQAYYDGLPDAHRRHIDVHLAYEAIVEWLAGRNDPMLAFKHFLFAEALADARRGYAKQPDGPIMDFYRRYFEIADAEFAELRMPKPDVVGKDGSWIYFPGVYGDKSVRPVHKFKVPAAQLLVMSRRGETLVAALEPLLDADMSVRAAASQAMVSLATPAIDHRLDFDLIEPAVRQSLHCLRRLRAFALRPDVRETILRER